MKTSSDREHLKTTCPRDCYDSCGITVVRRAGRVTRVLGDPDHPVSRGALCGKCAIAYNGAWRAPGQRLATPLRRTGPKGSGQFAPASWDEALEAIAGRLNGIRARDPAAILTAHYTGTCSLLAGNFPMRLFNAIGASEVDPDTVCNAAGHVALELLYGTGLKGFDPRTLRHSACLLVWGANPAHSAPHAHKHWLRERGCPLIVVDPIRTDSAALADLHLAPRPGSDAALAFGLLNVLQRQGAFDQGFISTHTVGFAELEPLIAAWPAERAAAETGVPIDQILTAARLYGAGPALLWIGQGVQRRRLGGNLVRAVGLLPALTGNVGKPGAGFYYLNGKGATRGLSPATLQGEALRPGPARRISHMDLADRLPEFEALFLWNINPAASNPQQRRLRAALGREGLFTVVADLFLTDSAQLADWVLPAAGFLEFDDLIASYMWLSVSAQQKVMEPPGDALPNQEIFRRLARAMGLGAPELQAGDQALIAEQLALSGLGINFAELCQRGTVELPETVLWKDRRFPTPSGRIELASERAEALGLPRLPLPLVEAPPPVGAFTLLTPSGRWSLSSCYGNDPAIQARTAAPALHLNPDDLVAAGWEGGMQALVRAGDEQLELSLRADPAVPRGTALAWKGGWPGLTPGGATINALASAEPADMGASTGIHSTVVTVEVPPTGRG